jgi:hypothetical protein
MKRFGQVSGKKIAAACRERENRPDMIPLSTVREVSMNRRVVFAALLVFGVGGCGSSEERLAKDQLSTMREMTTLLEGITDDASAQTALPKLEKAATRLGAINEKLASRKPESEAKPMERLKDPQTQQQIRELTEAGLKLMAAQMQAVTRVPGKAEQIRAAMRKAKMGG